MTLRTYLTLNVLSTIICFVAWALIVLNVDPNNTGFPGLVVFYLSLFFALSGLFSFLGFWARRKIVLNKAEFSQVGISFREGVLLSFMFVGMLFLKSIELLNTYNAALFIFGISLLEFYFMSRN
ncbi:MAG: hypothetical protein WC788_02400 [Candidatus Paceibacterota bacterium]|jgi:hypothetical protein